jgi:hypothetical protein
MACGASAPAIPTSPDSRTREKLSRGHDLAKAFSYMLRRWPSFTRFLTDGRICLTNNAAERSLRGVAFGRKAWLFCGSDRGGQRAAVLYSLIVTAKMNDVDPQAWPSPTRASKRSSSCLRSTTASPDRGKPMAMGTIANVSIDARSPDREPFTIVVDVGEPYQCETGEWACPVALHGLYDRLSDQRGADSFQALCLAIRLAHDLLRNFQEKGGTLLSDGEPFPLDAYGLAVRRA